MFLEAKAPKIFCGNALPYASRQIMSVRLCETCREPTGRYCGRCNGPFCSLSCSVNIEHARSCFNMPPLKGADGIYAEIDGGNEAPYYSQVPVPGVSRHAELVVPSAPNSLPSPDSDYALPVESHSDKTDSPENEYDDLDEPGKNPISKRERMKTPSPETKTARKRESSESNSVHSGENVDPIDCAGPAKKFATI